MELLNESPGLDLLVVVIRLRHSTTNFHATAKKGNHMGTACVGLFHCQETFAWIYRVGTAGCYTTSHCVGGPDFSFGDTNKDKTVSKPSLSRLD